MGAAIRIGVDDARVQGALKRLRRRMRDMRDVFDEIGRRLMTSTDMRFKTGTAPSGEPWTRSGGAEARGDGSERGPRRGLTLVDTGRLRQSITRRATAIEVRVGTNVAYAGIHQLGGKTAARTIRPKNKKALYWPGARHPVKSVRHPGSTVPARPFLGVSRGDEAAMLGILRARLAETWK